MNQIIEIDQAINESNDFIKQVNERLKNKNDDVLTDYFDSNCVKIKLAAIYTALQKAGKLDPKTELKLKLAAENIDDLQKKLGELLK